ncbi:hypothetical protein Nepgr_029155 [Nepenthes gracilis]|uniref:Uncharacterized protein n=1 Tax=Nepenthes gracilis TaxID=150966 RepID=A0AAD3Y2R5_NEPGR|nr:hypothetical protein Nepgr_029155 [Nepenthes gracilis]
MVRDGNMGFRDGGWLATGGLHSAEVGETALVVGFGVGVLTLVVLVGQWVGPHLAESDLSEMEVVLSNPPPFTETSPGTKKLASEYKDQHSFSSIIAFSSAFYS